MKIHLFLLLGLAFLCIATAKTAVAQEIDSVKIKKIYEKLKDKEGDDPKSPDKPNKPPTKPKPGEKAGGSDKNSASKESTCTDNAVVALEPVLYLMRQDYKLVDENGKTFIKKNLPYYGREYGIGIVIGNAICTDKFLAQPWENGDPIPAKYKDFEKKYSGVQIYDKESKSFAELTAYTPEEWEYPEIYQYGLESTADVNVLQSWDTTLPSSAFFAAVYAKTTADLEAGKVQIKISRISLGSSSKNANLKPAIDQNAGIMVGGVLFAEDFKPASLTYIPIGIYSRETKEIELFTNDKDFDRSKKTLDDDEDSPDNDDSEVEEEEDPRMTPGNRKLSNQKTP
jgi:hypothetical protein